MRPWHIGVAMLGVALGGTTPARAQEAAAANGHIVTVDGHRVYYEESGTGSPLLLLHGWGGSASFWRGLTDSLTARHRVIAVDLPGHARSAPLDTSLFFRNDAAARRLLGLLDVLGIDRAAIVGFSQGGMIGLYMATLAPSRVTDLVTIGAQAYYAPEVRTFIESGGPDSANAEVMRDYTAQHGPAQAMQLARQFWYFRVADGDPALTPDRLARIRAHALVIHGGDDFIPLAQAWTLYGGVRGAHLWVVPHAGHFPFRGAAGAAEFGHQVRAFLAGEWTHDTP